MPRTSRPRPQLRHPKRVLVAWVVVLVALAVVGGGVQGHLRPAGIVLAGTGSAKAQKLTNRAFGGAITIPILLQGPASQVGKQGRRLAKSLLAQGRVKVLSPWEGPLVEKLLEPKPGNVLLLAEFNHPDSDSPEVTRTAQRLVGQYITPPVRAHLSGIAVVSTALKDVSLRESHSAELIVLPVLLLVLLLVFRSPIAAAIPLAFGGATVAASAGVIALIAKLTPIDAIAVSISSMMGLALGVDYALLIVSRFREELGGGAGVRDAVERATKTAGRTTLLAGIVLIATMLAALLIIPGGLLLSVTAGIIITAVLSVTLAVTAMPPLLLLVGSRIDRWRIQRKPHQGTPVAAGWPSRLTGRSGAVSLATLLALLALAWPVTHLTTGPFDVRELPSSNPARQDFDAIQRAMGAGWLAPYQLIVSTEHGSIVSSDRQTQFVAWQRALARNPDVATILGPGSIRSFGDLLASQELAEQSIVKKRRLQAAQILVIPRTGPNDPATNRLGRNLDDAAKRLARSTRTEVAIGGQAALLRDYDQVTASRFPFVILGLALVAFLVLAVILRAIVLPAVAVALNLVTVAAAFGVLTLIFQSKSHPLGGPGYIDVISAVAIFSIIFALSIDYEVFLLVRMREGYLAHADTDKAVDYGLRTTAKVVSGAAFIMTAVFLAFSVIQLTNVRQIGLGLAVAVAIDATLVRLILLPQIMRRLGRWNWWLPGLCGRRPQLLDPTPALDPEPTIAGRRSDTT